MQTHLLSIIKTLTNLTIGGSVAVQPLASLYCFEDIYILSVEDPIGAIHVIIRKLSLIVWLGTACGNVTLFL
jgi:hypothetical protein